MRRGERSEAGCRASRVLGPNRETRRRIFRQRTPIDERRQTVGVAIDVFGTRERSHPFERRRFEASAVRHEQTQITARERRRHRRRGEQHKHPRASSSNHPGVDACGIARATPLTRTPRAPYIGRKISSKSRELSRAAAAVGHASHGDINVLLSASRDISVTLPGRFTPVGGFPRDSGRTFSVKLPFKCDSLVCFLPQSDIIEATLDSRMRFPPKVRWRSACYGNVTAPPCSTRPLRRSCWCSWRRRSRRRARRATSRRSSASRRR